MRCAKTMEGDVCLPTCGGDAQCAGQTCDPQSGLCAADAGAGAPTGTPCTLGDGGTPSPCAGTCIFFKSEGSNGICSRPCVLGAAGESDAGAINETCGGPQAGLCAFHPDADGPGDTGYCAPACTTPSDCLSPGFGCFSVSPLTATFSKGYCLPATPCPNGQQNCGTDSSYVCTITPSGPQCLNPAFLPAAPDGGSPDAGDAGPSYADAGPSDTDAGAPDAWAPDAGDAGAGDDGGDEAGVDGGSNDPDASDADPSH